MSTIDDVSTTHTKRGQTDVTLPLLRNGYGYLTEVMRRHGEPVLRSRLFGRETLFIAGADATRLFYDETRLRREGAVPGVIGHSLFGRGTVHALDDDPHRHRKGMFLDVLTPQAVSALARSVANSWRETVDGWETGEDVSVFDEAVAVLARNVTAWAGVSAPEARMRLVAGDLATIVDGFGGAGLRQWRARAARVRVNRWAGFQVRAARGGYVHPSPGSALYVVSFHRDENGDLLPEAVAADELLNVLRPTVAVAWFITFAGHAMYDHPKLRPELVSDGPAVRHFVDELRRVYPFAPALAAIVREDFTWRGVRFPAGRRVILDVYGSNHDPERWPDPDRFDPTRFSDEDDDPFAPIPQGGGDAATGHRCPGEPLTRELLSAMVPPLANRDGLTPLGAVSMNRIPPNAKGRFTA